jgi:hypothetical protein
MDYAQYEELLRSRMLICGWVFGILAVGLAVIFLCVTIKLLRKPKRWRRKMDIFDFIPLALCLFSLTMGSVIVARCNYDIKNQAYIVYEGKFTYVPDGKNALIFIPDRSGVRLEVEKGDWRLIDDGIYTGTVIYSERSKVVVDCSVAED